MSTARIPANNPPVIVIDDSDADESELSDHDDGYETEPELLQAMGLSRDGSVLPPTSDAESSDEEPGGKDTDDDAEVWETESLLEDALDEMANDSFYGTEHDPFASTPEESKELRALLKKTGEERFLKEVIVDRGVAVRRVLNAFHIQLPDFINQTDGSAMLRLLQVVLAREMVRRSRLPHINSVEHVVRLLRESKNIVVLTGAGISTSLGIPDFRSKGSGLYSRLEGLGLSDPQEVFDIEVFTEDPTIFYSIAKDILPLGNKFSPTHAFIAYLQSKQKLLTQYTQNIDNLEIHAGILPEKLIQCHGSFATASCVKCKHKVLGEKIFPELRKGIVAKCDRCLKSLSETSAAGKKRKRRKSADPHPRATKKRYSEDSSAEEEEMNFREAGVMKPDITFFGEQLPDTFHKRLVNHDRGKADLLICIGTSLKVAPVSEIIGFLPPEVPQIYISKTPVNHVEFDVELLGSCDEVVAELCRLAGWDDFEHEMIPKERREVRTEKMEGSENRWVFTTVGKS